MSAPTPIIQVPLLNTPLASATAAGAESAAHFSAVEQILLLYPGNDLANANATVNPGSDAVSLYIMRAGTMTTNRVLTIGVTGTLIAGASTVWIVRLDLTANTLTVRNGGANGISIADVVLPASPTHPMVCGLTYDGVDMIVHTVEFIQ